MNLNDYRFIGLRTNPAHGKPIKLEIIGRMEIDGDTYVAMIPFTTLTPKDLGPDYGIMILREVKSEGLNRFETVNDWRKLRDIQHKMRDVIYFGEDEEY